MYSIIVLTMYYFLTNPLKDANVVSLAYDLICILNRVRQNKKLYSNIINCFCYCLMLGIRREIMYIVKKRRNNDKSKDSKWYANGEQTREEQKRKREQPRIGQSPNLNSLWNVSNPINYESESD